ncbi:MULTISPECIES: cysteine hydrolase family protein [Pseudomonas]|jgi:nicotinamidase-related amidase|uniref:Cysteine hydrolase n=1 Tax=Pseudomonas juntendi TaxID=2666183 RepID=A0A7W2JF60_9PSED|nr:MULTISPECIES: cysteine hydrolase family protein [Pseudomonas]MBA6057810.1 cysteine hydrolase [Pseudomonas juntendi]MBA6124586.1 cysteine hydrolase [Pseudomonas juntendi]MBH3372361.1 cysteine hydrolase [Pseudomonas juntendi]MBS6036535.1 cysteine hydrolase [Pseudomonas sp.]MDH0756770.1 cysteine hydrolase [Pseudomonas juntendi]
MNKHALIIIDIQNDYFPGGKWPLDGAEAAAENAARVLAAARTRGDLVVHVRHEFTSADAPFFAPGSPGAAFYSKVQPAAGEPVILKHKVNAFLETGLEQTLRTHGIEAVTIVGSMSHMCIDAATRAAADLGFEVTVVHDACATLALTFDGKQVPAAQVQDATMAALAFAYAKVVKTSEMVAEKA